MLSLFWTKHFISFRPFHVTWSPEPLIFMAVFHWICLCLSHLFDVISVKRTPYFNFPV